jgi:integrase
MNLQYCQNTAIVGGMSAALPAATTKKTGWPKVRQVKHKNGTKAWLVDARINGKGERLFFKTKVDADTKAAQFRVARRNEGHAAFSIPEELRLEASKCAELLRPFGKTLTDAVAYYLPYLQNLTRPKPLPDLVKEAANEKRADGLERPTIIDFEHRCGQFVDAFPDRDAASISTDEIEQWLRHRFSHPTSRNNARKAVVNLFNFAVHKKYVPSNPAAAIKKAKVVGGEIGILKPSQIAALLLRSTPDILPYFAIAAFAGIRPEELLKMEWSDVRWKQGIIRVRAEISKVGASRNVHIGANLAEWLQPYRHKDGMICPSNWRKLFRQTRLDAGVKHWPADCLRHSFGTYWLEKNRNGPALALEMGNSVEVILRHYYKVLDEPEDAERFWSITPSAVGDKVISIERAA